MLTYSKYLAVSFKWPRQAILLFECEIILHQVETLGLLGERKLNSESVLERLSDLFVRRGVPDHFRGDNGPEFTAERVRDWLQRGKLKTLFIETGSPWKNRYIEYFNVKLRDELLNEEIFDTLWEAKY